LNGAIAPSSSERFGSGTSSSGSKKGTQRGAYARGISVDKKLAGERVGFVALREIGRAELVSLTVEEILAGAE